MRESEAHELQVRRFLLGKLDQYERRRLEERIMVSAEYQEYVRVVEENLIEDYVDGALVPDDRRAFETHFVTTSQQRHKVTLARILSTYTLRNSERQPPSPQQRLNRWSISSDIRSHPVVFASLAAVFLIVVSVGIFKGVLLWRESSERAAAAKRTSEIERELAQLNSGTTQAPAFHLALVPLTLRDAHETATLPAPSFGEIIELRLILTGDVYPRYATTINRIGTTERYSIEGLVAQSTENGRIVAIRIPSRLLTHGEYKISLNATTNDGKTTNAGLYQFQVGS